jgi:rhodanese-related sulfurtransferase
MLGISDRIRLEQRMPTTIGRRSVQRLLANGATLIDVLPDEEFENEHIAGAVHIPLRALDRGATAHLERHAPVVVYCWDLQCDLSARAAWRLESLGFTDVYDYEAGEMDWVAYGLPTEGKRAGALRVSDIMRTDIPICGPRDRIGDAGIAVRARGWEICAVLNPERVVLGLLHGDVWNAAHDTPVEDVMSNGPPTTRPSTFLDEMVERLQRRNTPGILISSSNGVLMGYLWRSEAETALASRGAKRTWTDRDCSPSEI